MSDETPELLPPFEIYDRGVEIGDANGHLCTAENPALAQAILAALRATRPTPAERPVPQVREAGRNYTASAMQVCISLADEIVCNGGTASDVAQAIRDRALYALPPDEPARVTPSTVGVEDIACEYSGVFGSPPRVCVNKDQCHRVGQCYYKKSPSQPAQDGRLKRCPPPSRVRKSERSQTKGK